MEPAHDLAAKNQQKIQQDPRDAFAELEVIEARDRQEDLEGRCRADRSSSAGRDKGTNKGHSQDEPELGTDDET
jgi:hypothetical protein